MGLAAGAFALASSVWLFLPLRGLTGPWSAWGDPTTWRGFWRMVTRADYGGLKLHPAESVLSWTSSSVADQLFYFIQRFAIEWRWVGIGLGVVGFFWAMRSTVYRRWAWAFGSSWVLAGPAFVVLSNLPLNEATTPAILEPYWLLMGVLWSPFVAWGAFACFERLPGRVSQVLGAAACVALFINGTIRAQPLAHRRDFFAYDYGRNILHSLPPGSVLYDPDDPTSFTIRSLQATEGRRLDVIPLNFFLTRWGYVQMRQRWPDLLPPQPVENAQQLQSLIWDYSILHHPFFVELPQKLEGRPYKSMGLVYQAAPPSAVDSFAAAERDLAMIVMRGRFSTTAHDDFFTRHLLGYYAAAHANLGLEYANQDHDAQAIGHYRKALLIDPLMAPAYNNWAITAYKRGRLAEAIALYQKALTLDPSNEGFHGNLVIAQEASQKLNNASKK
jgi:hypothetical protein